MEPNTSKSTEENNTNQPQQSTWDGDKMMSIAAIFISVLSMFAITYQSYLAREENEMMRIQQSASVLPYLSHSYYNGNGEIKYVFENKGVGPAFIKEVRFKAITPDKDSLAVFSNVHEFMAFLEQKSSILDDVPRTLSSFYADKLMSQNEVIPYITFPFKDGKERELIWREYNKFKIGINVVYEDIYGTAWELNTNNRAPIKLEKE